MKTLKTMVVCFLIGTAPVSCSVSSSTIITDYGQDANFNNYRTFYWSDDFQKENGRVDSPIVVQTRNISSGNSYHYFPSYG